jgi:hypothetical protein
MLGRFHCKFFCLLGRFHGVLQSSPGQLLSGRVIACTVRVSGGCMCIGRLGVVAAIRPEALINSAVPIALKWLSDS